VLDIPHTIRDNIIMDDFRTVALPYCLKKMEDGTYIILNRKYKPIGFNSQEHVIYEDYPIHHKIKGINRKTATSLSWNNSDNTDTIFLYNDGCVPTHSTENMSNYLNKLKALAKYKVTR